jgi:glucose-1-phosphate thymidylyltransferase
MKGMVLAGGLGSRLYPLTLATSKQLHAVYDKPMVYYPLATLMENGIREICLICMEHELARFELLLGNGHQWGITIEYRTQSRAGGIAEVFIIADDFIADDSICLILGDNIFYPSGAFATAFKGFAGGATLFASEVCNPQEFGVVELSSSGIAISLNEKPNAPNSNLVVVGIYLYDNSVVELSRRLRPSPRGELEITDINREYLGMGRLIVHRLDAEVAWWDVGTSDRLHQASRYVEALFRTKGINIGCPEVIALTREFISLQEFEVLVREMPLCEYRKYLRRIAMQQRRNQGPA